MENVRKDCVVTATVTQIKNLNNRMSNIALDKYIATLVGNGSLIFGATLLGTSAPQTPTTFLRLKNPILAFKGSTITLAEANNIADRATNNTLHKDLVSIGNTQYLITTVTEKTFLGREINTQPGGGVVIVKTAKSLLIAQYIAPVIDTEVIFTVEKFAENLPQ